MPPAESESPGWLRWIRRNERRIALAYLVGVGILFVSVAFAPARRWFMGSLQTAVRWWDDRWTRRLEEAERLAEGRRPEEALVYMASLDRVHPATDVRHGRDKERERLLRLLAEGYEKTNRPGRAMDTYRRLAAFDSLNYLNHYRLGLAASRLNTGADNTEAKDAFATALRILPAHLPSLRGYLSYYLDRAEFRPVVDAYQEYLDALLVQEVDFRIGGSQLRVPLLVDGRSHDLELPLAAGAAAGSFLEIGTAGFAASIERAELVTSTRVGHRGSGRSISLDLSRVVLDKMERAEHSAFRGIDSASTVRIPLPALPGGVARIDVRIAIYKPLDLATWQQLVRCYDNLLDRAGLAAAAARTVTQATPEDADRVLSRLRWAREGEMVKAGERPF